MVGLKTYQHSFSKESLGKFCVLHHGHKIAVRLITYLLTYLLKTWIREPIGKLTGSQLVKNSPRVMESKGSLPHSQVPVTCLYSEPDRPRPCPHIQLPEDPY